MYTEKIDYEIYNVVKKSEFNPTILTCPQKGLIFSEGHTAWCDHSISSRPTTELAPKPRVGALKWDWDGILSYRGTTLVGSKPYHHFLTEKHHTGMWHGLYSLSIHASFYDNFDNRAITAFTGSIIFKSQSTRTVSYTHLTLPTIYSV